MNIFLAQVVVHMGRYSDGEKYQSQDWQIYRFWAPLSMKKAIFDMPPIRLYVFISVCNVYMRACILVYVYVYTYGRMDEYVPS